MHNEEPPEELLCMLKWCSAACAVTQHNLKMNVHPISLPVADCHRLAMSTTCPFGGSSMKHGVRRSPNYASCASKTNEELRAQHPLHPQWLLGFHQRGQRKMSIFLQQGGSTAPNLSLTAQVSWGRRCILPCGRSPPAPRWKLSALIL